jgi:uroporphyrinogen-III decarboxylase
MHILSNIFERRLSLMKWTREQYIELMTYGNAERPMFSELFGTLIGLDDEWRVQGATEDEISLQAFDFDYVPVVNCGGLTGIFGAPETRVIEDNPHYTISIDSLGRTMKLPKGKATLPLPLDFPVKDMDSWLKVKPYYEFDEKRIDWSMVEQAQEESKQGSLVLGRMLGGFDLPRDLMGEEGCCIAYYDEPELIEDIIATVTDTTIRVLDRVSDKVHIDNLFVHEDMAGKSGPLIGPNIIYEFIKPYYTKVWEMLSSKGTKLFSQDSDGNMNPVIDAFIECGVNIFFPNEPAAGMDVVQLHNKYGKRIATKGGIDKFVLRGTKNDILRELEYKIPALVKSGGAVIAIDHRIPNGTPIDNYRFYVKTVREMLGLPESKTSTHRPMAF